MQYTREVTAFGPRPIGSANHKKLENYILAHLKGDQVEDDAVHRRHSRRQVSGAQHHRQVSRHARRHHRHRRPLRHQLSAAQYRLRRRQRRRFLHRHPARIGQPVARQEARWLQRLAVVDRRRRSGADWTATDSLYGSAPSGRQMAERRHAEEDQGLPAGRHDRRRRPQHRPRHQFDSVAAKTWSTRPPRSWAINPTFSRGPSRSKTITFPLSNAACLPPI